jgi:PAS domain S-box-containing protein
MRAMTNELLQELEYFNQVLRSEEGDFQPITNTDPILDTYTMGANCVPVANAKDLHDMYNCSGTAQLIRIMTSIATNILDNPEICNGTLECLNAMSLLHITTHHFEPAIAAIQHRITELSSEAEAVYKREMIILCCVSLLVIIVAFVLELQFLSNLQIAYDLSLTLLKRLPPKSIVGNGELLDYIMRRKKSTKSVGMSAAQSIFHNSADGIIVGTQLEIIDHLNPASCKILGCSQEDLLGQQMIVIFDDTKHDEVLAQIRLLRDHQANTDMWEGEVICNTWDERRSVLCQVYILAFYASNGSVSQFVIIIKDISEAHSQQIESQKAKAKSELLLYSILPRSIVARLASGESDVTFVVPEASVMCIDIIKFSEFASDLTPKQIMGTLSSIFGSFDERIAKWKSITKIKLIGDVYMCAAGLFNDYNPAASAEEMLCYAAECLQCLEDQNVKLDICLNVRIGINTGGPIIAGVLGTDNRVFDIIGDAINVAARLQSTSQPNTIQMSQSTYNYVKKLNWAMQRRDNVKLKGKEEPVSTWLFALDGSTAV